MYNGVRTLLKWLSGPYLITHGLSLCRVLLCTFLQQIFFVVTSDDDMSAYYDILPTNGSILFNDGQSFTTLEIQILPDATPEHEETFTVTLTGATEGTVINPEISSAKFTIRSIG